MKSGHLKTGLSAGLLAVLVLAGCGGSSDSEEAATAETTQQTVPASDPATTESTTATSADSVVETETTAETVASDSTTNLNIAGGNNPEDFLMPDVMCMNLQEAQDEIQDHGVFYSRSEDATGEGRMQIVDSNWIVVRQSPQPGTKFGEGDALLSVVKIGESTNGAC